MFDIDGGKLLIIGIVALVVIGPKELPGVLRQVGQAIARLRRMANEFQGQFMDAMREAELDELRKDVTKMAKVDLDGLDPFDHIRKDVAATQADIESALQARATEPAADSPASVELPHLADTPGEGHASLGASGIGPGEAPLPEPSHSPEPLAEPLQETKQAVPGGHA